MRYWVAVVKTPLALLQKQPKMRLGNTVEFVHMTLRLTPKVLNAVDVIPLLREALGMVDAVVLEIAHVQHIITAPTVGINDAVRNHFTLNNWHQGC